MLKPSLLSVPLLALLLAACGETAKEKQLERKNRELTESNSELSQREQQAKNELELSREKASKQYIETMQKNSELVQDLLKEGVKLSDKELELTQLKRSQADLSTQLQETQKELETLSEQKESLLSDVAKASEAEARLISVLEEKIRDIQEKEEEIASLKSSMGLETVELQAQIRKLQKEQDDLQKSYAESRKELDSLYKASLRPVKGLWLNPEKLSAITGDSCYEMVYVEPTGKGFIQGITCESGKIQYQNFSLSSFAGKRLNDINLRSGGSSAPIGFALVGSLRESSCSDASSLLKTSDTLIFEMTKEANGGTGTLLASYLMRSKVSGTYKSFESGTQTFSTTLATNREAMAAFTENDSSSLGLLGRAALSLMLAHDGLSVEKGCFTSTGEFKK